MNDKNDPTPVIAVLEPGYADYGKEATQAEAFGAELICVGAEEDAFQALQGRSPVAVMVRERTVTRKFMDHFPSLKLVIRYGVGVDNIDLDAARERGIYVANVPDYGAEQEVSDHAVALYLAVARRVVSRDAEVRRGLWSIGQAQPVPGHRGAVLGLIGFGKIAKAACSRFRALGFDKVLVSDPGLDAVTIAEHRIEAVGVERICEQADLISLHAPLTPATRHILNAERIALLKPTAILVNVSRGGLVDEHALAEALRDGRLFGAGVDVFETEPPSKNNPLLHAPNVVLSDHAGWYSEHSVRALQDSAARQIEQVFNGESPENWVNPW